jgi:hypothetical protein
MARMIPDSIPVTASKGEKLLYIVLRDRLPDDFIVWHEPRVDELYPDFIILGPTFGLLIIEVKGWWASKIERSDNNFFHIRYEGRERAESQPSPLKQGHGYITATMDKLKEEPILTHYTGRYQGKLMFLTGFGAVMSNITTAQAHTYNIYQNLKQPQVPYRDELLEWKNYSETELIQRLKAMFPEHLQFLDSRMIRAARLKQLFIP